MPSGGYRWEMKLSLIVTGASALECIEKIRALQAQGFDVLPADEETASRFEDRGGRFGRIDRPKRRITARKEDGS